jgi:hypothetical protein
MNATIGMERVGRIPESLWRRILAEPDRTPEWVALAALERFGPQAERWVQIAGPGHAPAKLAKIAVRKHVRLARLEGGALGVAGGFGAAADLVALLWIQSRMVFYVAAAFGFDPRDPMRPAELLFLQGVYPSPAEARSALDGAGKRMALALTEKAVYGKRDSRLAVRLMRYGGTKLAKHYGGRLIPVLSAPIGAVQNAGAAKDLGRRALAYYGRAAPT